MELELEAKFINIDKKDLRKRLRENGATLVRPELKMKKTIFDLARNVFARVRDEGDHITVTYKNVSDASRIDGTHEVNLIVDDYDRAVAFITALGIKPKAQQETYRESWTLDGAEIDIDTWPWLPTFVEIEGTSVDNVRNVAEKLGFDFADAHFGSVDEIYKVYYNVSNDDINFAPEIKFTPLPDWLKNKQKYEFKLPDIKQQKE